MWLEFLMHYVPGFQTEESDSTNARIGIYIRNIHDIMIMTMIMNIRIIY